MKILTKEQEREHYNEALKGGTIGGLAGLGLGLAGVYLASQRYHFVRQLTLPLKAFLVTSSGTFAGIVSADHWSRSYESQRNPLDMQYRQREEDRAKAETKGMTFTQRAMEFGRKERYKIVVGSWVGSMFVAFAMVNRNKFLTGQQKLVQARVYAQFLTLGVLVASAAFEIADSKNQEGRWESVKYIDPKDPDHKRVLEKWVEREPSPGADKEDRGRSDMWKDMVEAEEQRMKEKEEEEGRFRKEHEGKQKKKAGNGNGNGKEGKKETKKEEKKDDSDKDGKKKEGESEGGEKKEDKKKQ